MVPAMSSPANCSAVGISASRIDWSRLKRLTMRPAGVASKNEMGARSTAVTARACSALAARSAAAVSPAERARLMTTAPPVRAAKTPAWSAVDSCGNKPSDHQASQRSMATRASACAT